MRYAIAGCGKIAERHAALILQHGRLVAVCDINRERLSLFYTRYQAEAFTDIAEMCKSSKPDVLVVCTPNGLHARHSIVGFKYGCHVICEKPMALNTSDCSNMIRAAELAGKHLFVVKQNRYNPPVVSLVNALNNNLLGNISHVQLNCYWNRDAGYYHDSWHGSREMDGGILFTQFSHFVDIVVCLFGEPQEVTGFSANRFHEGVTNFSDTVIAAVKFKNGVLGSLNFSINSFQKNLEGSITVFGHKGTVKVGGQYLNLLEYALLKDGELEIASASSQANDYGYYEGSMSNHHLFYKNVVDVLEKGGRIDTTPQEGLLTVSAIEKIYAKL